MGNNQATKITKEEIKKLIENTSGFFHECGVCYANTEDHLGEGGDATFVVQFEDETEEFLYEGAMYEGTMLIVENYETGDLERLEAVVAVDVKGLIE